jgi:hypothetical protein
MHVQISVGADGKDMAAVTDSDNLRQLDVELGELGIARVSAALNESGLGTVMDGLAWLSIERLKDAAQANASLPDWDKQWDGMIAYATTAGWVSNNGTSVRAHLA